VVTYISTLIGHKNILELYNFRTIYNVIYIIEYYYPAVHWDLPILDPKLIKPNKIEVLLEESIQFRCLLPGFLKWSWNGGKTLPQNAVVDSNILLVYNVKDTNEGYYECESTADKSTISTRARLIIPGKPLLFHMCH